MKHTPGPWQIKKWKRNGVVDGCEVVVTDSRGHGLFSSLQFGAGEKVMANAALIATAPEMHTLLISLRDFLDDHFDGESGFVEDINELLGRIEK